MPGRPVHVAVLLAALAVLPTPPAGAHDPARSPAPPAGIAPHTIGLPFGAPRRAEPPSEATPQAPCEPGSRPEAEIQGRVSAAAIEGPAKDGYWCNLTRVSHDGRSGGFKVHRYVDKAGRECAYYDTALLVPLNALNLSGHSMGVTVLDMADPARPVHTAQLVTPAMLSPHETLVVSQRRGLLAAVAGNPTLAPGIVDLYDISADCRHPVLQSSLPIGFLGHESGFTRDGKTLYSASPASKTVVAVDVTEPRLPVVLFGGNIASHGLSLSDDGNRAYVAAVNTGTNVPSGLQIFDTSEIQSRKHDPRVRQVGSLTWDAVSIPQNAIPVTIRGRRYVIEVDEYRSRSTGLVGAARIIDIADETKPHVVSNLRLAVHEPKHADAVAGDPGAESPLQGYAGHYCDVPRRHEPGIVACSMIASGLRVFDIRDPERPREVAYHVAPPSPKFENAYDRSNFAMSAPAFAPERREVWYTDGTSGFYNLRLSETAWPKAATAPPASARLVRSFRRDRRVFGGRRSLPLRIAYRLNATARVEVTVLRAGRVVRRFRAARRTAGRTHRLTLRSRGLRRGRYTIRIVVSRGREKVTATRSARKA